MTYNMLKDYITFEWQVYKQVIPIHHKYKDKLTQGEYNELESLYQHYLTLEEQHNELFYQEFEKVMFGEQDEYALKDELTL